MSLLYAFPFCSLAGTQTPRSVAT